ncbi:MAG: DUF3179 domain-containing protein [Acidobacteriota bacterium]|nr:DUF3179 domain-containing protein [Acidobacteriota bacterium]
MKSFRGSALFSKIILILGFALSLGIPNSEAIATSSQNQSGWSTNQKKRSIDLSEIMSGGVGKDGIPAINEPRFETLDEAKRWLNKQEPVIALAVGGEARAYPLQILIWHEIVNDIVGKTPVAVTFCPLCYSAIAFDRTIDGRMHTFGVSGMLRKSDMVMYDRETESWWQQMLGEAIVGDLTGKKLAQLPAQIISFERFSETYQHGRVLSRETGHRRDYGRNPYTGYDDINQKPFLFRGKLDDRLPPMEKLVTVTIKKTDKAYPHSQTRKLNVIHDEISGQPIVIFHTADGAVSALDNKDIGSSRQVGDIGVFDPRVDGKVLHFKYRGTKFVDEETGSEWNITGQAMAGKLKGRKLTPLTHGHEFAFAWLAFKPNTVIWRNKP